MFANCVGWIEDLAEDLTSALGCIFIVFLCIVSYFPLRNRLAMEDVQSLSYGAALSSALPLLLTAFAFAFCMSFLIISSRRAVGGGGK